MKIQEIICLTKRLRISGIKIISGSLFNIDCQSKLLEEFVNELPNGLRRQSLFYVCVGDELFLKKKEILYQSLACFNVSLSPFTFLLKFAYNSIVKI